MLSQKVGVKLLHIPCSSSSRGPVALVCIIASYSTYPTVSITTNPFFVCLTIHLLQWYTCSLKQDISTPKSLPQLQTQTQSIMIGFVFTVEGHLDCVGRYRSCLCTSHCVLFLSTCEGMYEGPGSPLVHPWCCMWGGGGGVLGDQRLLKVLANVCSSLPQGILSCALEFMCVLDISDWGEH